MSVNNFKCNKEDCICDQGFLTSLNNGWLRWCSSWLWNYTLKARSVRFLSFLRYIITLSVQVVLSQARAQVQQQYAVIRESLDQEEQTALQCVTKEESRVLGGLEEKLSHLRSSLQSVQRGLNTLEGLADAKGDKCIQDQAFIVVRLMLRCSLFKYNVY